MVYARWVPRGRHEYHIVAAIFGAASGTRISDATAVAQISGVGLSGWRTTLKPMTVAPTFGAFVDLPGADLYAIKLVIQRPGVQHPTGHDLQARSPQFVDGEAAVPPADVW